MAPGYPPPCPASLLPYPARHPSKERLDALRARRGPLGGLWRASFLPGEGSGEPSFPTLEGGIGSKGIQSFLRMSETEIPENLEGFKKVRK